MTLTKTSTNSPKLLDIDGIREILESGEFDKFEGARENSVFEFKTAKPYVLDSADSKEKRDARFSLSYDVVSFMNSEVGTGYIVLGLNMPPQSKIKQSFLGDVVYSKDLVTKSNFYESKTLHDVIVSSIHPEPKGIEIKWYPYCSDSTVGLGAIYIPKQKDSDKVFFIKYCPIEGERQKGFVAFSIRKDDKPDWYDFESIHDMTRRSRTTTQKTLEEISLQVQGNTTQLNELKRIINSLKPLVDSQSGKKRSEDFEKRIKEILDEQQ